MAVAFHGKGFGHFHAAGLGNAAYVVARQVNQHDVLGPFFRVVDQLVLGGQVGFGGGCTRSRARQRSNGDLVALGCGFLAHQNLGRRPHHMEVTHVVVVHVRAGVQGTQSAVKRQRAFGEALFDALPHLHLHEITGFNQAFGAFDSVQVIGLGEFALRRVALRGLHHRRAHRVLEHVFQIAQAFFGTDVGLGCCGVGVHHQVKLARQVVDDRQFFGLQQQDVGASHGVGWAAVLQLFLDVAHRVVAKVTGQSATKARHARAQGHFESLLIAGNEVQRVAVVGFHHHAVGHDLGVRFVAKTIGTQQGACWQPNEAVAAKALAAHHRLQQKTVLAAVLGEGEFEVQRKGGFQVCKSLDHQGNAVVALGRQAFEFKFCDHGEPP